MMSGQQNNEMDDERYASAPSSMPPSYPPRSIEQARAQRLHYVAPGSVQAKLPLGRRVLSSFLEFGTIIAIALLFSIILKTFFLQAFEIPSGSMEDTILVGDRVVVNKLADSESSLQRGDIVVFVDPGQWLANVNLPKVTGWRAGVQTVGEAIGLLPKNAGSHLIKRLIGMPGDHVACCDDHGRVTINGTPLEETYLKPGVAPSEEPFDVTVPRGHMWVMGDNRSDSSDSRYHHRKDGSGFVPLHNVEGRAWLRILPLSRFGLLPDASDVFANVPPPAN